MNYDYMVVIMANCPGHSVKFLDKSLSLMIQTLKNLDLLMKMAKKMD